MKKDGFKKVLGLAIVGAMVLLGCKPKEVALMQEGIRLELTGRVSEAKEKYAEAAALGNAEGMKKLGDIAFLTEFAALTPRDKNDFVNGYDSWLAKGSKLLDTAAQMYEKAIAAGCTNQVESALAKLVESVKEMKVIQIKVDAAKEAEKMRLAELKKQREAEAARKKAESERKAAEARRRESPEYCIENDLELSAVAFREVVRELCYSASTGNELVDREENEKHHSRFMGKWIKVKGTIRKIEKTFFTDEVKCIIDAHGKSISARFDGMPDEEGRRLKCGMDVRIYGRISDRIVLSDIAMDSCKMQ